MLYLVNMDTKPKTFHLGIRIDEDMRKELNKLAEENRRNPSDYARIVLEDHIKDKKKQ